MNNYLTIFLSNCFAPLHFLMHERQKIWLQSDMMPNLCSEGGCFSMTISIHIPQALSLLRAMANECSMFSSSSATHIYWRKSGKKNIFQVRRNFSKAYIPNVTILWFPQGYTYTVDSMNQILMVAFFLKALGFVWW